jgi:hypothetical protein
MSPFATVPPAAGTFSPLRTALRLDNHRYSPTLLERITAAAARLHSFADAAFAMHLAGVEICARHVQRIATEMGAALAQQRDQKATLYQRRQLPARVAAVPEVVAAEVDGGRLRTRAVNSGPGVHDPQYQEDKVACFVSLSSSVSDHDPQPQPPPSFVQPRRVQRLVQQLHGQAGAALQEEEDPEVTATATTTGADGPARPGAPHKRLRTCVASMADSHTFGLLMAAEAQERDFYHAARRAFVGDGASYNWWIQRAYFPDFEPITDFLHVLCYLYLAASGVGASEAACWALYVRWLEACWQGQVQVVIRQLRRWQGRIGMPDPQLPATTDDPRQRVADALGYLQNNASRMDYPRYRQQGLPITSSLAESLVGEVNARVKSREKFWNRPKGSEDMLQLRSALLSEDGRLERFFAQRPGNPYRRRQAA